MIEILRTDPNPTSVTSRLASPGREASVAIPTLFELRRGIGQGAQASRHRRQVERLGEILRILPLDRRAALLAGDMAASLDREGMAIPDVDLFIAAITIASGDGVIITRDLRHFRRLRRFGLVASAPVP